MANAGIEGDARTRRFVGAALEIGAAASGQPGGALTHRRV